MHHCGLLSARAVSLFLRVHARRCPRSRRRKAEGFGKQQISDKEVLRIIQRNGAMANASDLSGGVSNFLCSAWVILGLFSHFSADNISIGLRYLFTAMVLGLGLRECLPHQTPSPWSPPTAPAPALAPQRHSVVSWLMFCLFA